MGFKIPVIVKNYLLPILMSMGGLVYFTVANNAGYESLVLILVFVSWMLAVMRREKKIEGQAGVVNVNNEKKLDKNETQDSIHQLIGKVNGTIGESMTSIKTELGQVRDLTANSIMNLNESFYGINNDVLSQADLIGELAGRLNFDVNDTQEDESEEGIEGEEKIVSISAFISQTSVILKEFVKAMIHNSKHSMDVVSSIDDLSIEMGTIFKFLEEVKQIAEQTNL